MRQNEKTAEKYQKLQGLCPMLKGISMACGSNCEVSLHSLGDLEHSVIAIENGFITNRQVGDGMIPLVRDQITDLMNGNPSHGQEKDVSGIFYTYNASNHPLKGVVSLIRNEEGELIGCMEILIDVGIPLHEFVKGLLPSITGGMLEEFNDHVPNDTDQLISTVLAEATAYVNSIKGISSLERNRMITKMLNQRGIFNIRGSVETVAKELGTSRYTIYNYLRDTKD